MKSRREVLGLGTAAVFGGLLGRSGVGGLKAEDTKVTSDLVRLHPSIEPIVRLIETTPREKCFEAVAAELRKGLSYREFLAALFLAGIRNVNPQPPGFKFHCVFVIHACHQASLDASLGDRLLPLFFALDAFKASQEKDVQQGDFQLQPVAGRIPSPETAVSEFHTAMQEWDEDRADRAIVGMIRGGLSSHLIIDHLWQYGARDYRNIGHKAIFVANTWRTLQTIGWRHAEPAMRSLVRGLLDFGAKERLNDFAFEDQTWIPNDRLVRKSNPGRLRWKGKQPDSRAALQVLETCREAKPIDACLAVWRDLNAGLLACKDAWDGVFLAAGELMMQQPAIYGVHTVTSTNALRYAYDTARTSRIKMLLQAVGWLGQFRQFMGKQRSGLRDIRINDFKASNTSDVPNIESIFDKVGRKPDEAAQTTFDYAAAGLSPKSFAANARALIFRKGTDAHDYKYSTAMFEDYFKVSPAWRPHMLATSVYNLRGTQAKDSSTMTRAKAAIQKVG